MQYEEIGQIHIPCLAPLYVETYNAPPWNDGWTVPLAAQKLEELILCPGSYGLVALDDRGAFVGAIVGCRELYYDCVQFYIKDFFVSLHRQGEGIGSAMMREFEARLKGQGIDKTYLFTSRSERTEGFYQKRGYASWNDMVMMGKRL